MLVLARKVGEQIIIDGNIRVTVNHVGKNGVKLSIDAPKSVRVDRLETHIKRYNEDTAQCNILETQPLEKLKTCRITRVLKPDGEEIDYGTGWLAKVLQSSKSKIKIHIGEMLPPGTVVTIGFGKAYTLSAIIYLAEKQDNGSCIVNAEFNSHLTENELALIH